ncbi:MAG: hypothetical protein RR140_00060 [Clostridia bacterium]
MPKILKQELKDQFTLRIYKQEDKDLLDKVYEKNKAGFDNVSDFIRFCVISGAEKLIGDNEIDQRLNLNEIKELLKDIKTKLFDIKGNVDINHYEQKTDSKLMEKMLNYISNIIYNSDCNKECSNDLKVGLFNLPLERLKVMNEIDK